ncbi:MAG: DNA-directed RNA polymerase subunit alpha C-terminal domain-containing protein [Planctomycetota bacterium]|jgi:hypothetical protein
MSDYPPSSDDDEGEESPLQVDIYGVKARLTAATDIDTSAPLTITSVAYDVGQSLLRIGRDLFGLVADLVTGSRSLVRGTTKLKGGVDARIKRAHDYAERAEANAQQGKSPRDNDAQAQNAAVANLEDVLRAFQARGVPVQMLKLPSGGVVITLVCPEHQDAAGACAESAVQGFLAYSDEDDDEDDVLGVPLSDLELSVRLRNCLQRLGIETIGDVTRITEPELMSSKNFGEITLVELREVMSRFGLQIGQAVGRESLKDLTVDELGLSVRAANTLSLTAITTVAELVERTADELLALNGFGVTSLNEVRRKLAERGLHLRNDGPV